MLFCRGCNHFVEDEELEICEEGCVDCPDCCPFCGSFKIGPTWKEYSRMESDAVSREISMTLFNKESYEYTPS